MLTTEINWFKSNAIFVYIVSDNFQFHGRDTKPDSTQETLRKHENSLFDSIFIHLVFFYIAEMYFWCIN